MLRKLLALLLLCWITSACKTMAPSTSEQKDVEHIQSMDRQFDGTFKVVCMKDVSDPSEFYIEPNTSRPEPITSDDIRENRVCRDSIGGGAPVACRYEESSHSFEVFSNGQFYRKVMDGPPRAMRCGSRLSVAFDGDELFVFSVDQHDFRVVDVDQNGREDLAVSSHLVMFFDGDEVFLVNRVLERLRIDVDANGSAPGRFALHDNGMFFYDGDEVFVGCTLPNGGFADVKRYDVSNGQEASFQSGQQNRFALLYVGSYRVSLNLDSCVSQLVH